jgi:hypothetical protein
VGAVLDDEEVVVAVGDPRRARRAAAQRDLADVVALARHDLQPEVVAVGDADVAARQEEGVVRAVESVRLVPRAQLANQVVRVLIQLRRARDTLVPPPANRRGSLQARGAVMHAEGRKDMDKEIGLERQRLELLRVAEAQERGGGGRRDG